MRMMEMVKMMKTRAESKKDESGMNSGTDEL